MIGFEPGYESRVVADDVTFTLPEYLLQAALDASYAAKDHTHTADQISGLEGALGSYLTKTDAANTYQTRLATAAGSDDVGDTDRFIWRKTSDNSVLTTSWYNIKAKLRTYFETLFAKVIHSHSIGEVSGLQDQLNSKITRDGRAYPRAIGGGDINFHWSGQGGQPTWIWGGNDGVNMYVYNPSNFSVNYANSTWNAERLQGWDVQGFLNKTEERAAAWARQEAGYRARKCGSWGQWNFTSHDQRMQNQTGENIYYTAYLYATNNGFKLEISPDNATYWTVGTPSTSPTAGSYIEFTGGCLPPGWWMRIIRINGSYNANVILVW